MPSPVLMLALVVNGIDPAAPPGADDDGAGGDGLGPPGGQFDGDDAVRSPVVDEDLRDVPLVVPDDVRDRTARSGRGCAACGSRSGRRRTRCASSSSRRTPVRRCARPAGGSTDSPSAPAGAARAEPRRRRPRPHPGRTASRCRTRCRRRARRGCRRRRRHRRRHPRRRPCGCASDRPSTRSPRCSRGLVSAIAMAARRPAPPPPIDQNVMKRGQSGLVVAAVLVHQDLAVVADGLIRMLPSWNSC